jgi:hypothetical protein
LLGFECFLGVLLLLVKDRAFFGGIPRPGFEVIHFHGRHNFIPELLLTRILKHFFAACQPQLLEFFVVKLGGDDNFKHLHEAL